MDFLSVCSGIEAASVAWHELGWRAIGFSEIEPYPRALLAQRYPHVPNYGDMTTLPARIRSGEVGAPDVLCGGTPCQAFSVAGMRKSLDDARGNLSLVFCGIADEIDAARHVRGLPACIIKWENVPGVLSTKDNAFGCFLAGLAGSGQPLEPSACPLPGKSDGFWKWDKKTGKHSLSWSDAGCVYGPSRAVAWRVLDAQYFGLAQRRRRVFVVASARAGFDPAAVLFEFEGVRRDSPPSREARSGSPVGTLTGTSPGGGRRVGADEAAAGHAIAVDYTNCRLGGNLSGNLSGTLEAAQNRMNRGHGVLAFDSTQITSATNRSNPQPGGPCHTLAKGAHAPAIAFDARQQDVIQYGEKTGPLDTDGYTIGVAYSTKLHNTQSNQAGKVYEEYTVGLDRNSPPPALLTAMQVRRLTPRECERLQGFPDDYTLVQHGLRVRPEKLDADWIKYLGRGNPKGLTREEAAGMAADGPRYKALGNSWAVPCARWIGRRIAAVAAINNQRLEAA